MRKLLFILLLAACCCCKLPAQVPYLTNVDLITPTTNTSYSYGVGYFTNALTGSIVTNYYVVFNTNSISYGTAIATCFYTMNLNFNLLSNYLANLGAAAQTPWTANENAAGFDLNNAGTLRSTNLFVQNLTWLDASNLSVFRGYGATGTNMLEMSGIGVGTFSSFPYFWNPAIGMWTNSGGSAVTNGGFGQSYNGQLSGSLFFLYYSNNATTFPGTNNSWIAIPAAGPPYTSYSGTLIGVTNADIVSNNAAIDIRTPGGLYVNGVLVNTGTNGAAVYKNTSALAAGVIAGFLIGTNPVDQFGNTLVSWLTASNLAVQASSDLVTNYGGWATNLTVVASFVTNSYTVYTNGGLMYVQYLVIEQVVTGTQNTNQIILYNSDANINGTYQWDISDQTYDLTNSVFSTFLTYDSGTASYLAYDSTPRVYYQTSVGNFPFAWTKGIGTGSLPPYGYFAAQNTFSFITNTYNVIVNLGGSPGLWPPAGVFQPALNAQGVVNAQLYLQDGITLQNLIQYMSFPTLWVTNCTGNAVSANGIMYNTWAGYFTNANNIKLIPKGFYGTGIDGTNFNTAVSLICSNTGAANPGRSFYANSTNVTGGYQLVTTSTNSWPTNSPIVTIFYPGMTTNLQFVDADVVGGIFTGTRTNTLCFTNGLLMNVTTP